MAHRIEERFTVAAPVERVWALLIDPQRVVTCLPGAELVQVIDERTFEGKMTVKVGPVTVPYRGQVHLGAVDEAARTVKMTGDGRETTGSGSARMEMESRLVVLPSGETQVTVVSDVDVVGRLVQLGRGMIPQVAHQIFLQFAERLRRTLEAETPAAAPPLATGAGHMVGPTRGPATAAEPVRALPLLFKAFLAAVADLVRRLFGGRRR